MEKESMDKVFTYIEKSRPNFEEMLKNEQNPKTGSALDWVSERLRSAGAEIESSESAAESPTVLRATLGKGKDRKTLLIYGHLSPKCNTKDFKLFGTDIKGGKGPVISLFTAIDTYKSLKIPLPVNIKFLFEATTEKEAKPFRKYIHNNSKSIFAGVDHISVLGNRTNPFYGQRPILCWSLRGCCKFEVTIECGQKVLHAGDNGGAIQEAMTDMVSLLSCTINSKGDILIPGIKKYVAPLTAEEEKEYQKATFDIHQYKGLTGANRLLHKEDKKRVLLHMTRFPSLSIHGIESAVGSAGENIPSTVKATFSIRTVPNQTENSIQELVTDYLVRTMTSIKSSNKITVRMTESSPPWVTNPKDPNIKACMSALKRVYREEAELVREGGTIPVLSHLQENSGKNVLLLPIGRARNNSPTQSDMTILIDATKIMSAYFHELGQIK